MGELNVNTVYNTFKKSGYFVNIKDPWFLNIYGIRAYKKGGWVINDYGDWNDSIGVLFMDTNGNYNNMLFVGTVDPDLYYMKRPMNNKGTAHLIKGQYLDTYKIGLHRSTREALCQRLGPVKVLRRQFLRSLGSSYTPVMDLCIDPSNNYTFEGNDKPVYEEKIDEGYFGINIHDACDEVELNHISAGCQVFYDAEDFKIFMSLCKKHRSIYKNSFNYTLFDKIDFEK